MTDQKHEKLSEMVEDFCDEYLNEEYNLFAQNIIEKMADERSVPFKRGKLEVWASAVIYVVCQINSLFDDSNEVHITRKDIFKFFNTNQSTVSLKANNIRNRFNLDNEFSLVHVDQTISVDEDIDDFMIDESDIINRVNMSISQYQKNINDYKQKFGKEFFKKYEGEFWLIPETRPFMQCLLDQAHLLWDVGEKERAVNQFKYMLKLNPNDNQGVRDVLLPCLLELNRLDEAKELYLQFEDDYTSNWKFNKLLLDIKLNVSFDEIENQYHDCREFNPYVVPYLIGKKEIPLKMPGYYSIGDKNEAIYYAFMAFDAWNSDKRAIKVLKKLSKK